MKPTPDHSPTLTDADDKPERIAKRIARAGLCSRRDAERWIEAGRVSVNGRKLDTPARTVTSADNIEVDGKPLPGKERTRLWLYHKRSGTVTTSKDPEGRETIFDALPEDLPRVLTVGRLDINTEGLILLTNDGGLSRVLELPSTGWLRRYRVRAHGDVNQEQLDALKEGVAVDGVLYGAIDAELERRQASNVWLLFAIREGKNREVKNVLASLGLQVNRLIRISYGPFQLGDLPPGQVREIRGRTLRDQLGGRLVLESGANFDIPDVVENQTGKPLGKPRRKPMSSKVKKARKPHVDPLTKLDTKPGRRKPDSRNRKKPKPASRRPGPNADRRR